MNTQKIIILFIINLIAIPILYSQDSGTFTDTRDGHKYRYITIGEQVWMTENLSHRTSNGSSVYYHGITDPDTVQNNEYFGRLYTHETSLTEIIADNFSYHSLLLIDNIC